MNKVNVGISSRMSVFFGSLKAVACGLIGCLFFAVSLASSELSAQEIETIPDEETWQNGFHGFAELLRKKDVQLLSNANQLRSSPRNQTILVAFGEMSNSEEFVEEYLSEGGAVLLASDLQCEIRHRKFAIWIDGNRKFQARNSVDTVGNSRDNIIISRFRRNQSIFDGVRRIATNRPSTLSVNRGADGQQQGEAIARYPSLVNTWSANRWDYPFLFRYEGEQDGRILALPDHSVFNNAMLGIEDNLPFTLNAINWLKEGGRTSCLLLIDGVVQIPSRLDEVQLYLPPPDARETREALKELLKNLGPRDQVELVNEAMNFAQDEGLINEFINSLKLSDFVSWSRLLAAFIVISAWALVTLFVVLLVSNRATPLASSSIDGLNSNQSKEEKRRHFLERFRSSEAMFIHFFNRIGFSANQIEEIDASRIFVLNDPKGTRRLQKEINTKKVELSQQPLNYWSESRVGGVGHHIAQWANLYDTGTMRILAEGETVESHREDPDLAVAVTPPVPQIIH